MKRNLYPLYWFTASTLLICLAINAAPSKASKSPRDSSAQASKPMLRIGIDIPAIPKTNVLLLSSANQLQAVNPQTNVFNWTRSNFIYKINVYSNNTYEVQSSTNLLPRPNWITKSNWISKSNGVRLIDWQFGLSNKQGFMRILELTNVN